MPKAVPKFVSEMSWYLRKYAENFLSREREIMAGLSLRNVMMAPSDATPGRLKIGFMTGRSIFSTSETTPNSTNTRPSAPVSTQTLSRKNTVLSRRSWAVAMRVFIIGARPISYPR